MSFLPEIHEAVSQDSNISKLLLAFNYIYHNVCFIFVSLMTNFPLWSEKLIGVIKWGVLPKIVQKEEDYDKHQR